MVPRKAVHGLVIYDCPGKHNPDSYDLSSAGPDGIAGTEDDIASWKPDN